VLATLDKIGTRLHQNQLFYEIGGAGLYFYGKLGTDADAHVRARTLISMNIRTKPYSYEHPRETELVDLEIEEVCVGTDVYS